MTPCEACGKPATGPDRCQCSHYCRECGCRTNHTTEWHREAAAEMPQEP